VFVWGELADRLPGDSLERLICGSTRTRSTCVRRRPPGSATPAGLSRFWRMDVAAFALLWPRRAGLPRVNINATGGGSNAGPRARLGSRLPPVFRRPCVLGWPPLRLYAGPGPTHRALERCRTTRYPPTLSMPCGPAEELAIFTHNGWGDDTHKLRMPPVAQHQSFPLKVSGAGRIRSWAPVQQRLPADRHTPGAGG